MPLTLAEQVDYARQMNEETRIFVAEQHALMAEQRKLAAKRDKLDQALAPWTLAVAMLGSFAACFAAGMLFAWASCGR